MGAEAKADQQQPRVCPRPVQNKKAVPSVLPAQLDKSKLSVL